MIAGRADFYFSPLVNALPLLKEGTLQALAVSGSSRASALPDVPTTVEAGYPNSEYNFWAGMFAPAKTPADIRAKLHAEIAKALARPGRCASKLKNLGADPMPLTSAQFEALVKQRDRDQHPAGEGGRHQGELTEAHRSPVPAAAPSIAVGAGVAVAMLRPAAAR